MKNNIFIACLGFGLLISGCSQKNVEIDTKENLSKYSNDNSNANKKGYEFLEKLDNPTYNNTVANDARLADETVANNTNNTELGTAKKTGLVSAYFGYNEFSLSDIIRNDVKSNSSIITKSLNKIRLEGNCDEWGSDEYNVALGLKRAKSVKDALIEDGVSESKIITISLGESNPVCQEKNEECWKQNRRVDFVEVR